MHVFIGPSAVIIMGMTFNTATVTDVPFEIDLRVEDLSSPIDECPEFVKTARKVLLVFWRDSGEFLSGL